MSNLRGGKIQSVRGQVVIVEFTDYQDLPEPCELLVNSKEGVLVEVHSYLGQRQVLGLLLSSPSGLWRGLELTKTKRTLTLPVGRELLGKVIDIFGRPLIGEGLPDRMERRSIYATESFYGQVAPRRELLETGIKAIDLFLPMVKGGKVGIVGGAGVGKTVLLTELMRNVTLGVIPGTHRESVSEGVGSDALDQTRDPAVETNKTDEDHQPVAIFTGLGERIREGHELWLELKKAGVLKRTVLLMSQMNENAAVRFRTAWAGATLAEYFRDASLDVLFFVDNIFRFIQAGSELSTLLGQLPSELGYQATMESEVSQLENRLSSTRQGSITSIQNVYVPADELSDPAVTTIMSHLDTVVVLSREIASNGLYPAIDPLRSSSSFLKKSFVGEKHFEIATRARELLSKQERLSKIVAVVGESELSVEDRREYQRGRQLKNYLSQPFFVTENQSWRKGVFVPRKQMLEDVRAIIEGKLDGVEARKLRFIGGLGKFHH